MISEFNYEKKLTIYRKTYVKPLFKQTQFEEVSTNNLLMISDYLQLILFHSHFIY